MARPVGTSHGIYRIMKFARTPKSAERYLLSVPREVAERVPENVRFTCELTEAGILYRAFALPEPVESKATWAKGVKDG